MVELGRYTGNRRCACQAPLLHTIMPSKTSDSSHNPSGPKSDGESGLFHVIQDACMLVVTPIRRR